MEYINKKMTIPNSSADSNMQSPPIRPLFTIIPIYNSYKLDLQNALVPFTDRFTQKSPLSKKRTLVMLLHTAKSGNPFFWIRVRREQSAQLFLHRI